eukprot:11173647-Lingulodinium_polyedra.AAC.1
MSFGADDGLAESQSVPDYDGPASSEEMSGPPDDVAMIGAEGDHGEVHAWEFSFVFPVSHGAP